MRMVESANLFIHIGPNTHSPTMRLFKTLLSVTLLVSGVLAAKKSSEERFNNFHSKSLSSTPIKLTDVTYKSMTAAPRDYSVTILLTALDPRYGCELCQGFQPEWETLAKSWVNGDKKAESRMLFGTLDFKDGRDTFLSVCFSKRLVPHAVVVRSLAKTSC